MSKQTETKTTMPEIFSTMATKASRDLDLCKAHYIIILPDGTVFNKGGDVITLVTPTKGKKTKQQRKVPYGMYTNAYKSDILRMEVGDVLCLKRTDDMLKLGVTLSDIQGTISTIASAAFGNDAHKVHKNEATDCVELLRTA